MLINMKSYFVYILASKKNGTLYVGVTSDLVKRVFDELVKSRHSREGGNPRHVQLIENTGFLPAQE